MTEREGEICEVCGYPVASPGAALCGQCDNWQQTSADADSAVLYAAECAGCRRCGSSSVDLRRKTASNGKSMFGFQCLTCGGAASAWIKRAHVSNPDSLPPWDEQLSDAYWRAKSQQAADEFHTEKALRQSRYEQYLRSPEWREKRRRVLSRARGYCEGCGRALATQVHHLTYDNIGDELLFQLVAICDDCHEKVHQKKAAV